MNPPPPHTTALALLPTPLEPLAPGGSLPGSAVMQEAADEGSLTGMLKIISEHADQAHGHRDRGIERAVHDAVQVRLSETADEDRGLRPGRIVVAGEQLS